MSNALDPWPTENGRPISTAPFFAIATTQRSAIRKIKKVVPGHVSTVWSPLIRLESARAVRTVTERSILRVPATAQGNGRLVGAQGISVTCRIGQLDRSLHEQRAIGSHPNFYVGHESLLFFRWIFPASHPNQDRYPQLHSCCAASPGDSSRKSGCVETDSGGAVVPSTKTTWTRLSPTNRDRAMAFRSAFAAFGRPAVRLLAPCSPGLAVLARDGERTAGFTG